MHAKRAVPVLSRARAFVPCITHASGHASGPALIAWGAAVSGPILEVSSTARLPHKSVARAALIYARVRPMQEASSFV